jgi:hypothetical protein
VGDIKGMGIFTVDRHWMPYQPAHIFTLMSSLNFHLGLSSNNNNENIVFDDNGDNDNNNHRRPSWLQY